MTSHRARQYVPRPNKSKRTAIVAVAVLLVLVFAIPMIRNSVRRGAAGVGATTAQATNASEGFFARFFSNFYSKRALVRENEDLKAQVAERDARLGEHDVLLRENEDLKAIMGRMEGREFTLAAIISKPPQSLYDTLVIDGGSKANLNVGQIVYANGEIPIGVISQVFPNTATVQMFSAPTQEFAARLDPSSVDVTLIGRGGGNFSVTVPHDVVVAENAVVVTKDINPHVVARLQKITSDARDPFQVLLLASPVNMAELSFVQVLK